MQSLAIYPLLSPHDRILRVRSLLPKQLWHQDTPKSQANHSRCNSRSGHSIHWCLFGFLNRCCPFSCKKGGPNQKSPRPDWV